MMNFQKIKKRKKILAFLEKALLYFPAKSQWEDQYILSIILNNQKYIWVIKVVLIYYFMWLVSLTLKDIPCTLFTGYLPPRLFKSFKEPIWATETFEISAQQDNGLIRESDAQSFGHKNCGMKSWTNFVEWSSLRGCIYHKGPSQNVRT